MIKEKILFHLCVASTATILLLSIFLTDYINGQWIMMIPISFLCLYIYSIIKIIRDYSGKTLNKELFFVESLLSKIEESHHRNQSNIKNLIHAIDRIGENAIDVMDLGIEGEAAKAIQKLQRRLYKNKEEESQRHLLSQGLELFSDLRIENNNLNEYSQQVINTLVRYLKAHQAAFYIVHEQHNQKHLTRIASYAHDNYQGEFRIEFGTGLIGQCALNKEILIIDNIPDDYIRIGSGLGESKPNSLTMVPLLYKNEVCGIIEIASFHKLPATMIDFVKKITKSIALEIADTHRLELEKQLKVAEMERMKNRAILEGCVDAVISFNERGQIQFANRMAEEIFGYSNQELLASTPSKLMNIEICELDREKFLRLMNNTRISIRTEINTFNKLGIPTSLLVTSTHALTEEGILFTLFIQKISVDLF